MTRLYLAFLLLTLGGGYVRAQTPHYTPPPPPGSGGPGGGGNMSAISAALTWDDTTETMGVVPAGARIVGVSTYIRTPFNFPVDSTDATADLMVGTLADSALVIVPHDTTFEGFNAVILGPPQVQFNFIPRNVLVGGSPITLIARVHQPILPLATEGEARVTVFYIEP